MFQFTSHKTPWHHCRPRCVDILSSFDNIITVIRWIFVSYQLNNNTLSRESRFLGTTSKCFTNNVTFLRGAFRGSQDTGSTFQSMHGGRVIKGDMVTGGVQEEQELWDLDYPRLMDLREWQSPCKRGKNLVLSILEGQFLGLDTTPITRICLGVNCGWHRSFYPVYSFV